MFQINQQMFNNLSYADEYIRAFFDARNEFTKYWCAVRGYDINNLLPNQIEEIQNHHDYARPSIDILPWGHLTTGDEVILRQYSQGVDCAIELGTLFGRGAAILSKQANNVVTIDNYQDPNYGGMYHTFDTVKHRLMRYRNVMCMDRDTNQSAMFTRELIKNKFDFIFIDGNHTYDGVKADFENWFPLMEHGAYILFHDYNMHHQGVLDFVAGLITKAINHHPENQLIYIETMREEDGSIVVFKKK